MDSELYVEPVYGYRTWRLVNLDNIALHGIIYSSPAWSSEEDVSATCHKPLFHPTERPSPHEAPQMGCRCGYHAFASYADVQDSKLCWAGSLHLTVRGAVIGWGKVVLGTKGWRAQYARPAALLHWPDRRQNILAPFGEADVERPWLINGHVRRLAERYCVPYVDTVEELEAIAAASGSPIPKEAPCQSSESSSSQSS